MSQLFKMMIVDDSNIIRRKIERSRDASIFDVVAVASDGESALQQLEDKTPDVVTMDLTMPRMDGIACIEAMMGKNPDIKVLVVSALSDKATGIEALEKGARGFICKPFSELQLSDALREMVGVGNV
ncbi:response regulator [Gilvimarinus sp. SDUM040013]|uniref:Response regulator n=1 Tax=Gilvimarinus gilvus TaxID=3058038 RepID=A0ABU4RWF7_9GAMM|nr:response regulator [Gilvimarinus sp. SDUM040013]MDO3385202.1 response regulator [Gilvimarinus sp. SDUM040013]MDX6849185.1 response regulator [Gilvimarinus sp. SDUM040013]